MQPSSFKALHQNSQSPSMSYFDLKKLKAKGSSVLSYLNEIPVYDHGVIYGYGPMYVMPRMDQRPTAEEEEKEDNLAPSVPAQQDFVAQWKAVTHYFIENKEHKVGVEHTSLPSHLSILLDILVDEERTSEGGSTGPCMEYLLQHRLLDTLFTLARTDCPPGMKQIVFHFYIKLLSRITQPLLPHINVHKPIQHMVRLCGETPAAPSENEEIQFLCTVCAKLRADPYLVNFFIEAPRPSQHMPNAAGSKSGSQPQRDGKPNGPVAAPKHTFTLVESLLILMHSPDARVGVKACEGLLLCASLPEDACAKAIIHNTQFCDQLTEQLCALYQKLPKVMDPADIYCVQAKWGLDVLSETEDHLNFPGKRSLISFLSWLDYLDQLTSVAHPEVATAIAKSIRAYLLTAVLEPAILQTSEATAITATAHLGRCLRHVHSKPLVQEFVSFILGDREEPETPDDQQDHKLRQRFLERCDHLSEELSITTLKIFEILLQKNNKQVIQNMFLRNLISRKYMQPSAASPHTTGDVPSSSEHQSHEGQSSGDLLTSGAEGAKSNSTSLNVPKPNEPTANDSVAEAEAKGGSSSEQKQVEIKPDSQFSIAGDSSEETSEEDAKIESAGAANPVQNNPSGLKSRSKVIDPDEEVTVHQIVNCFLTLLPEEAKSSYQTGDSGYETYLRDANRQFSEVSRYFVDVKWSNPAEGASAASEEPFFEGTFLKMLLDRLSKMFDQSYDVNLHVTSVISCLALIPHPTIDEYLLNPFLNLQPGCRSVPAVLQKLATDVESQVKKMPDFQKRLVSVRRQLMGYNTSIRRSHIPQALLGVEDSNLLAGVIVLEEFCKELAAIAFVKFQSASSGAT